jgi:hypothetical protein
MSPRRSRPGQMGENSASVSLRPKSLPEQTKLHPDLHLYHRNRQYPHDRSAQAPRRRISKKTRHHIKVWQQIPFLGVKPSIDFYFTAVNEPVPLGGTLRLLARRESARKANGTVGGDGGPERTRISDLLRVKQAL